MEEKGWMVRYGRRRREMVTSEEIRGNKGDDKEERTCQFPVGVKEHCHDLKGFETNRAEDVVLQQTEIHLLED